MKLVLDQLERLREYISLYPQEAEQALASGFMAAELRQRQQNKPDEDGDAELREQAVKPDEDDDIETRQREQAVKPDEDDDVEPRP